jgi:hypothetical protein
VRILDILDGAVLIFRGEDWTFLSVVDEERECLTTSYSKPALWSSHSPEDPG